MGINLRRLALIVTIVSPLTIGNASAADEAVLSSPAVVAFFQAMVDRLYAQGTGSASRIARAKILTKAPSLDLGEITDKGSLNSRAIRERRKAIVDRLYDDGDPDVIRP